jgi:hypothetical protein
MTEVFVLPLPEPANSPISFPALEPLAEIPIAALHRIIRGYGHIEVVKGQAVVCPDDVESAEWITKTLLYLGVPVAWWPGV